MKRMVLPRWQFLAVLPLVMVLTESNVRAQANLLIYTNDLVNGFQNWSWAPNNFANASPATKGTNSISASAGDWQALWLYHDPFDTSLYSGLSFWLNGGAGGGQIIRIVGTVNQNSTNYYTLPKLAANSWAQFTVPLQEIGETGQTNCTGFWFELTSSGTTNTFYLDDVELIAAAAPAVTHIAVNAGQPVRTADARWFGVNTAVWDSDLDSALTETLLQGAGLGTLRFPGGSLSDDYHWASNTTDSNTWTWATSFSQFAQMATNIGAQTVITVNYGTGTPAEAAAWVNNANVVNHYGFKYWEVGNEVYGGWETDSNTYPHDPFTYASRAAAYLQAMKAVDANIKVGVVLINGEDANSNGYTNHPATNLVDGSVHYGWTPVVLSTLSALGVTPDFGIFHWYPEYTDEESDPLLLQGTTAWKTNAANLRGMITDYFGTKGTNIELVCTENNSNSGAQGKQSTSLVNALYYCDSLAQLMQTEFNGFIWWDLRNGVDTTGNMSATLYGWRLYGDLGLVNGAGTTLSNRYPAYFAAGLMQDFIRGGDTVLAASSDYALLTAYAARRADGSLTLLVINKDPLGSFTGQIELSGFAPASTATLYSYGMPQDNASETGVGSPEVAETNFTGAATNFSYAFAPYSATVFCFTPAAPSLAVVSGASSNQFVVALQGQPGAAYVLETSTDLSNWTPVATNSAATGTISFTNAIQPGSVARFWRAVASPAQ